MTKEERIPYIEEYKLRLNEYIESMKIFRNVLV